MKPERNPVCKRLPVTATKAQLVAAHKRKMKAKAARRYYPSSHAPSANLSRNHPDYGCSPQEHEARKAAR